jgi:predicted nucleic acid-binding protein
VLGELLSGFAVGTRDTQNRQELEQFLASERVRQLVIDAETAAQYAGVYRELRRRGRPMPTNAMWIAASALQHGFAVCSDDGHFHEVSGLHVGMCLDDCLFCKERPVSTAKIVRLNFWTKRPQNALVDGDCVACARSAGVAYCPRLSWAACGTGGAWASTLACGQLAEPGYARPGCHLPTARVWLCGCADVTGYTW